MNPNGLFFVFLLALVVSGCHQQQPSVSDDEYRRTKEALVGANRILVKKDEDKIKAYLRRHNWTLEQTETGLWYTILEAGWGNKARPGQVITLDYTVDLLDGTRCYSSDSLGPKQFKIGQGGVESGLEEAVLFLREGSKARLILPPHLAHGLTGDGNRIPARAVIVYEITVRKIEE